MLLTNALTYVSMIWFVLILKCICVCMQSLVLLEDVDAAFPSREARSGRSGSADLTHSHSSDVTFSGLLNVLDGAASR